MGVVVKLEPQNTLTILMKSNFELLKLKHNDTTMLFYLGRRRVRMFNYNPS
jgi:hypothetical protein